MADLVQSNVGNSILVASLLSALGGQGTARCSITSTGICQLSEVSKAAPLVGRKTGLQGPSTCLAAKRWNGLIQLCRQIWMCLGVDAAGYPTSLEVCPPGSQLGTCDPLTCANASVEIPAYSSDHGTSTPNAG